MSFFSSLIERGQRKQPVEAQLASTLSAAITHSFDTERLEQQPVSYQLAESVPVNIKRAVSNIQKLLVRYFSEFKVVSMRPLDIEQLITHIQYCMEKLDEMRENEQKYVAEKRELDYQQLSDLDVILCDYRDSLIRQRFNRSNEENIS